MLVGIQSERDVDFYDLPQADVELLRSFADDWGSISHGVVMMKSMTQMERLRIKWRDQIEYIETKLLPQIFDHQNRVNGPPLILYYD